MKRVLIAAVVILVALGAGGAYVMYYARQQLEAGLARARASLPPGATLTYASADPQIFSRSAVLKDVKLVINGVTYTAAEADVAPDTDTRLRHLTLRDVTEVDPGSKETAASIVLDGVTAPGGPAAMDPKTVMFDHLQMHDFHYAQSPGAERMRIGDLTLDNYGLGRPSTLDMRTVHVTGDNNGIDDATADRITVANFDLAQLVPPAGTPTPASLQNASGRIEGMTINVDGKPLITAAAIDTGSKLDSPDQLTSHMTVRDFVVLANAKQTPKLLQMGYDRAQVNVQFDSVLNRAAKQFRITRFDVAGVGMGHSHMEAAFDNLPPGLLDPQGTPDAAQAALAGLVGVQLRSLTVSYDDESLFDKLRTMMAAEQHVPPATLNAGAENLLAGLGLPDAVTAPARAFLANPHRLAVTLAPPQPVAVAAIPFMPRDGVVQSLGLQVTN